MQYTRLTGLFIFMILVSSFHSLAAEVQHEQLDVKVLLANGTIGRQSEGLLLSRIDKGSGLIEHVITFLEPGSPAQSKTFRIEKKSENLWVLKDKVGDIPVTLGAGEEYLGFKYLQTFPDGFKLVRIFTRRADGTMKIVSSRFSQAGNREDSSVYEGKKISPKAYALKLKNGSSPPKP